MIIFDKEVDDLLVARWADAYAAKYFYQATVDGAPNPETKIQHMVRHVFQTIENNVLSVELPIATKAAIQAEEVRIKDEIKADKAAIITDIGN